MVSTNYEVMGRTDREGGGWILKCVRNDACWVKGINWCVEETGSVLFLVYKFLPRK